LYKPLKLSVVPAALGAAVLSALAAAESIEEVLVYATPVRDSQSAGIEARRAADNLVEVLSADAIGRFPDQNLADSLGRVPGLAIARDQGQARFVNLRGAPYRYTRIAFDGVDVPGSDDGRIPRFDTFPSVIASQVQVHKAVTPDMPGESAIGYINMQTFRPRAGQGWHFAGEVGQGRQALGGDDIDKVNGRVAYGGETFGLVLFGAHNQRGRVTDSREYLYADTNSDGRNDSVRTLDFRSFRGDREDNARGGRLELTPGDSTTLFLSTLYSEFVDREERNQFEFAFDPVPLGTVAERDFVTVNRLLQDGEYRNSTETTTLGYDGALRAWTLSARANLTRATNDAFLPIPFSAAGFVGATVDVRDLDRPGLALSQPGAPAVATDVNTLGYALDLGLFFREDRVTRARKLKFDASRALAVAGRETQIKLGAQYDEREAEGGVALSIGGFPDTVDVNSFASNDRWDTDFRNTIGGRTFDNQGLRDAWASAAGGFNVPFDADSLLRIDEDVLALYAMATTRFAWGSLIYGLRAEQARVASRGSLLDGAGAVTPVNLRRRDRHWLPSLHLNLDLAERLKLRLSATTAIARPLYSEMRASQRVDPIAREISGGNPALDPEEIYGFDATLEWYFDDASLLSIGAYRRHIDHVIYPASSVVDGSLFAPGLIAPGTDTTLNAFFNGDDGELTGAELSVTASAARWLPAPFDGLGFAGNLTFIDSAFKAPELGGRRFDLPGTSDLIGNASVSWEKYGWSVRLNYQYRDDWLIDTENESLSEFGQATERLDASLRYQFAKPVFGLRVTLAVDGNNLTNEEDVRYLDRRRTPVRREGFGRRWLFSVRADY
jgi:TonB-dependent receptor